MLRRVCFLVSYWGFVLVFCSGFVLRVLVLRMEVLSQSSQIKSIVIFYFFYGVGETTDYTDDMDMREAEDHPPSRKASARQADGPERWLIVESMEIPFHVLLRKLPDEVLKNLLTTRLFSSGSCRT